MSLTVIAVGTGFAWAWGRYKKKQRAQMLPLAEETLLLPAVPPMEALPEDVVTVTAPDQFWALAYSYNLTVNAFSTQLNNAAAEITAAQSLTAFQASVNNAVDALAGATKAGVQETQPVLNAFKNTLTSVGDYITEKKETAENMWLVGGSAEKII